MTVMLEIGRKQYSSLFYESLWHALTTHSNREIVSGGWDSIQVLVGLLPARDEKTQAEIEAAAAAAAPVVVVRR